MAKARLTLEQLMEAMTLELGRQLPGALELRQEIHQSPELSWSEHATSKTIAAFLSKLLTEGIADTGLLVRVGDPTLPAIGLRAELDALPISEQTGVDFASTNGAMHACGHDIHLAALATLLRAYANVCEIGDPPVAMLGIFQPSEEANPSGARRIIESHRLTEHGLRAMLAVHVHPRIEWGSITTGVGTVNACSDTFTLTVTGLGGHGAYPHHGHDPVLALCQVVVALQQIVSRRVDPMHPAVVSVTLLQAGTASNVIPNEAVAQGTVRVLIPDDREPVLGLLETIAANTAAAYGCTARIVTDRGDPVLVNDELLVSAVDPWLKRAGFEVAEPMRSCGADDFAFYGDTCPSLMMFLGVRDHCGLPVKDRADPFGGDHGADEGDRDPGLHHPHFLPDEATVERTALAMLSAFIGAAETLTPFSGRVI